MLDLDDAFDQGLTGAGRAFVVEPRGERGCGGILRLGDQPLQRRGGVTPFEMAAHPGERRE